MPKAIGSDLTILNHFLVFWGHLSLKF